jgi:hypothetical protein
MFCFCPGDFVTEGVLEKDLKQVGVSSDFLE